MRRHTGKIAAAESGGEQGFWPSYADMMSAVALILFFLMLVSYIQNLITGNDLQNTQEVLAITQTQVEDAEARLAALSEELGLKQDELEEYLKQIAQQTELLDEQKVLIGMQEDYLEAANEELLAMRNQMQTIAVLRLSILEKIQESIVEVMGDSSKVSIGDNGSIILSEGILFDYASSAIEADSAPVLDKLADVFYQFLSDPENAKYVDSIVISGHTDSTGSDWANRELSTERANSVLNYLFTANGGSLNQFSDSFCAAGYGATRPVQSNDTDAGRIANRRIEISMILKDESVLEIVEQYLAMELPGTEAE